MFIMEERWHIQHLNGDTIAVLTCLWKVVDKERELREQNIPYKTDFYMGTKLVKASDRK